MFTNLLLLLNYFPSLSPLTFSLHEDDKVGVVLLATKLLLQVKSSFALNLLI